MKKNNKIFILVIMILFLCGCSVNVDYDFNEGKIKSTINASFTLKDYNEENNTHKDEYLSDQELAESLMLEKDNTVIRAFNDSLDYVYKEDYFKNENGYYNASYSYEYDYDNFKDNYFFNNCFDNFEYTKDEEFYNIKLSGDYKCNGEIVLNIKSTYGIENSNSINIKGDTHSFNVYEENNDIEFSIRIKDETINSKSSKVRLIGFIIMISILIIGSIAIIIIKKHRDIIE